jgi:predicted O-methyltransferase YrrM
MNRQEYIQKLRKYWIENEVPNISDENARFLRDLIFLQKTKNMLEIGSANWFSAIQFWLELEKTWGKLTTIEFSEPSYKQVLENIKAVWLEKIVFPINWNALFEISKLKEIFDFVFIDWMKRRTIDFFDLVYDKVKLWWIIVVDDVIKFREKMWWFWDYLEKNKLDYSILPIDRDDWILFMVKRKEKLEFRKEKDY